MDLKDFTTACKLPHWGNVHEPHKSEYKDFLASITVGKYRDIAQATIGSIHFPKHISSCEKFLKFLVTSKIKVNQTQQN